MVALVVYQINPNTELQRNVKEKKKKSGLTKTSTNRK